MSTQVGEILLFNYDYSQFNIPDNSYLYYANFTTEQLDTFCWDLSGNYVALLNGYNAFNYNDPVDISFAQYVSIQRTGSIRQSVNITSTGVYKLHFQWTNRPAYFLNA